MCSLRKAGTDMVAASLMKQLCNQYLDETTIERRIHLAASTGSTGMSFSVGELSPDMRRALEAAGYDLQADLLVDNHLYVRWG